MDSSVAHFIASVGTGLPQPPAEVDIDPRDEANIYPFERARSPVEFVEEILSGGKLGAVERDWLLRFLLVSLVHQVSTSRATSLDSRVEPGEAGTPQPGGAQRAACSTASLPDSALFPTLLSQLMEWDYAVSDVSQHHGLPFSVLNRLLIAQRKSRSLIERLCGGAVLSSRTPAPGRFLPTQDATGGASSQRSGETLAAQGRDPEGLPEAQASASGGDNIIPLDTVS